MDKLLLKLAMPILIGILNDEKLQDDAAAAVAKPLVDALPDVAEDAVAGFLRKLADKVEVANA